MAQETLTHKDLAALAGVSVTTIKSYRRKFGDFIPVAGFTKPLRFHSEAGPACVRIRELFTDGLSVKDISLKLSEEFKIYPQNRHLSITSGADAGSPLLAPDFERLFQQLGSMANGMAAMATAQARTEKRIGELERALSKLLDAEARRSERMNGIEGLAEELKRTVRTNAANPKRVVTVQSRDGQRDSYVLGKANAAKAPGPEDDGEVMDGDGVDVGTVDSPEEPRQSDPASYGKKLAEGIRHGDRRRPPPEFLELPVVMGTERGEYLGITGANGKPFSLSAFETHLLTRGKGSARPSSSWRGERETWVCAIAGQDGAATSAMTFVGTRTPRGNQVALLSRLEVDGKEASSAFLQEFFREIRSALAR